MKRRKWTAQQKLQIVIQGLKGKVTVSELCNRHQISQTQYYQWKDRYKTALRSSSMEVRIDRLRRENLKLKSIIGDLTVELKKSDEAA